MNLKGFVLRGLVYRFCVDISVLLWESMSMKPRAVWVVSTLFLVTLPLVQASSPIVRVPGAIYLSDFEKNPLEKKLVRAARCFFDPQLTRYAGTLRFPQTVSVEAFLGDVCRIRGNAQQGGVAAWIPISELEPLPENFLVNLQKAEERRAEVDDLISRNEVAIGMTADEVGRSLGRPQKTTKRAEKDGLREVWEYIRYKLVPQTTFGPGVTQTVVTMPGGTNAPAGTLVTTGTGLVANTIYVKVPAGTLTVTLENGIVESMEQSEESSRGGKVSIVVPPLEVYW